MGQSPLPNDTWRRSPAVEEIDLSDAARALGRRSASMLTSDQLSARARKGGLARWGKRSQNLRKGDSR